MFRELDQRNSDHGTITLEWDPVTGNVQVRCEDHHFPREGFAYSVAPQDARLAFLHPDELRPSDQASEWQISDPGQVQVVGGKRRRRWFRRRAKAETIAQPRSYDWVWRMLNASGAAGCLWFPDIDAASDP